MTTTQKFKRSEKLVLVCLAIGAIAGAIVYFAAPVGSPWWAGPVGGFLLAAFLNNEIGKGMRDAAIIDRERED